MTLKYKKLKGKGYAILDLTSLTEEEFEILVISFEEQFQAHMREWCMDGTPRQSRRYTTYKNCPLPTAADRLLFILVYQKNHSLQVLQGQLFGMAQCKANVWIHLLYAVLQKTLQALGDTPSRHLSELAQRLSVSSEQASALVAVGETVNENEMLLAASQEPAPRPLFAMTAASERSFARRIRRNKKPTTVARKNVIP